MGHHQLTHLLQLPLQATHPSSSALPTTLPPFGVAGRLDLLLSFSRIPFPAAGEAQALLQVGLRSVAAFVCGSEILTFALEGAGRERPFGAVWLCVALFDGIKLLIAEGERSKGTGGGQVAALVSVKSWRFTAHLFLF